MKTTIEEAHLSILNLRLMLADLDEIVQCTEPDDEEDDLRPPGAIKQVQGWTARIRRALLWVVRAERRLMRCTSEDLLSYTDKADDSIKPMLWGVHEYRLLAAEIEEATVGSIVDEGLSRPHAAALEEFNQGMRRAMQASGLNFWPDDDSTVIRFPTS